jgi:cation:H+ antiporter
VRETLDILRLVVGVAILYWGAEWLIRGSASLARAFGVKALVIGLTVVAYGTSAPELAVSTEFALSHRQPTALGNVIGSCVANISLILGLTALIAPPSVDPRLIRRELPILLGSAIAVPIMLADGVISSLEGGILVGCAMIFTIVTLTVSSRDHITDADAAAASDAIDVAASYGGKVRPKSSRLLSILMSAGGLALLVLGSDFFVDGASAMGKRWGLSERVLGLTLVAVGTSLPELIASVTAATRGHASLAVGSVIGANLLNVFLVLGVVAYLRPVRVGERLHMVDVIGLVAITLLAVLFLRGSRRINRVEGAILVAAYVGFLVAAVIW